MPDDSKIPNTKFTANTRSRSPSPIPETSPVKPKKQKTDISENPFLHELEDQESFKNFRENIEENLLPQICKDLSRMSKGHDTIYVLPDRTVKCAIGCDEWSYKIQSSDFFNKYINLLKSDKCTNQFHIEDVSIKIFNPHYSPHKDPAFKNQKREWTLAIPIMNYNIESGAVSYQIEATHILKDNKYQETDDDKKGMYSENDKEYFKSNMYPNFISNKGIASLFPKSTHKATPERRNSSSHATPELENGNLRFLLVATLVEK